MTGAMDEGMDAQEAYLKSFGSLKTKTKYWDPVSGVDLRPQAGFKATTTTTYISFTENGVGNDIEAYIDTVSVKPLTLADNLTLAQLGFQSGRYWFTPAATGGDWSSSHLLFFLYFSLYEYLLVAWSVKLEGFWHFSFLS